MFYPDRPPLFLGHSVQKAILPSIHHWSVSTINIGTNREKSEGAQRKHASGGLKDGSDLVLCDKPSRDLGSGFSLVERINEPTSYWLSYWQSYQWQIELNKIFNNSASYMLGLSNRQAMNSWVVEYVGSENKLHSNTIPGIWYSHLGLTDWQVWSEALLHTHSNTGIISGWPLWRWSIQFSVNFIRGGAQLTSQHFRVVIVIGTSLIACNANKYIWYTLN